MILLASKSASRRAMLAAAGVEFEVRPAAIDERALEAELVDARPAEGEWDRTRIEQVVTNLLSNAFKYGAGRPIHVEVGLQGKMAVLTVRDEGIGIPIEDQSRIFGPFERAVSERHYTGFGVGLWVAQQVVEAHGGSIHVVSAPSRGTTFRVWLPSGPAPRGGRSRHDESAT